MEVMECQRTSSGAPRIPPNTHTLSMDREPGLASSGRSPHSWDLTVANYKRSPRMELTSLDLFEPRAHLAFWIPTYR